MHTQLATGALLAGMLVFVPGGHADSPPRQPTLPGPGGYIGLGLLDLSDDAARDLGLVDPHGVEVASVSSGSPAAEAGLKEGDIVLTYRGERVQGYLHLARLVRETPAGRAVELGTVRDGERRAVEVTIEERPENWSGRRVIAGVRERIDDAIGRFGTARVRVERRGSRDCDDCDDESSDTGFLFDFDMPMVRVHTQNGRLGADLEKIDGQLAEYFGAEQGLLVRSVRRESPAEEAGLLAGDVILAVDGKEASGFGALGRAFARSDGGAVTLEILRDREELDLTVDLRPPSRSDEG